MKCRGLSGDLSYLFYNFLYRMYRSCSQDITRATYQHLGSKIQKIKNQNGSSASLARNVPGSNSPLGSCHYAGYRASRPGSGYRGALAAQPNGMFGIDVADCVGRVARNPGIKKYNQRHINQLMTRNSAKVSLHNEGYARIDPTDYIRRAEGSTLEKSSMSKFFAVPSEARPPSATSTIKVYEYSLQRPAHSPQTRPSSELEPTAGYLQPGRIYAAEQLQVFLAR